MRRHIDCPVYIRTGSRLMAIGEKVFEVEYANNMLYIHIGGWIDMGVFVDGGLLARYAYRNKPDASNRLREMIA